MRVADQVRDVLRALVAQHGAELCSGPKRLEALLRDSLGSEGRREINVLLATAREGVPAELLNMSDLQLGDFQLQRLARRVHEETGIAEDLAVWAIETWAEALGKAMRLPGQPPAQGQPPGPTVSASTLSAGQTAVLHGHESPVVLLAFSSDGSFLASAAQDGELFLWRTADGKLMQRLAHGHWVASALGISIRLRSLAFSTDDKYLIYQEDSSWKIYRVPEGGLFTSPFWSGEVQPVLSPDCRFLAVAGSALPGNDVRLLSLPDGDLLWARRHRAWAAEFEKSGPWRVIFSPEGRLLASIGPVYSHADGPELKLWDVSSGKLRWKKSFPYSADFAFSPDSHFLAVSHCLEDLSARRARDFDNRERLRRGERVREEKPPPPLWEIELWDLRRGALLGGFRRVAKLAARGGLCCFSPDGELLATTDWAKAGGLWQIKLWRVADGRLLDTLQGHKGTINELAWSASGKFLRWRSADESGRFYIYLWRAQDDQVIGPLKGVFAGFSPDDELLASEDSTGIIRVCRATDGGLLTSLIGKFIGFSGDGQHFLCEGADGFDLRRVQSGHLVETLRVPGDITAVAFHQDSRLLAVGRLLDGSLTLWRVPE